MPNPYRVVTLMPSQGNPTIVQAATLEDEALMKSIHCHAPELDMCSSDWTAFVRVLARRGVMILLDTRTFE
jgi:hypothetical protein